MPQVQQREVVKFIPSVPVEVALKYAMPGKVVSTRNGERVLFTLADNRVMFLDLSVARKVEDLGMNVREKFFVRMPPAGNKTGEWDVWRSPESVKPAVDAVSQLEFAPGEESSLERKLRESIELVRQGKLGELGNGTFAVPAGASGGTPAPVQSGASNGHQTSSNGHVGANGKNGNGGPSHPYATGRPVWAESLLEQASALVDVYAAALHSASTKHGNQVKPEDVRSLLVTVFIQRSRVPSYGS